MTVSRPAGRVQYDHSGRVVLVTGGSGGIGRAIGEAFARSGASVVILDIQTPDWQQDGISFQRCDTSRDEDCRVAVEWALAKFHGIDVLVNNAAIQPADSYRPVHQLQDDVIQRMIDVNLRGYQRMAQLVIPCMLRQGSGVIVNMASGQAHRTAREVGVYGPIKSANVMQARQWGVEYARFGIRAVSVSPGAIDTPMVRASLQAQGGGAALANRHPLGRIGRAEEVASAVLWLSSDDASFVTATDLEVDGGLGAFGAFAEPYPIGDVK
jgi:NAD(P)-dependent dehydrogenase (short-subunit alcohol dehydrogenase family)